MDQLPPHLTAERRHCVILDATRKCGSLRYTLQGQSVQEAYIRRETEEFNMRHRLRNRRRIYAGSYSRVGPSSGEGSGEGSSASPLQPWHLELEAFEPYDVEAFEDAIGPEDFVSGDIFKHVSGVVHQRSIAEEHESEKCRRIDQVCGDVLIEQGFFASLHQQEKAAEWDTKKKKQKEVFVDLYPDE